MAHEPARTPGEAGASRQVDEGPVEPVVRALSDRVDRLERELRALREELERLGGRPA